MAYLKVLIAAITALWSILFVVYSLPSASSPSPKQAICKHTAHYSLSGYTAFEESAEDCKKSDDQKNAGKTDISLQINSAKFWVASVAPKSLSQVRPLYLIHRRLLI